MPATKFIGRPRLFDVDNKNADILFVQTCMTRYLFRIQHVGDIDFKNYFDWQLKFISSLLPAFQKKLRLRLYQSDFGWDLVDLWREFCPEVVQEGWDIPFMESLANCRLFLCDNCSTTYLESLSANKPSILFWNSELFPMQKGAIPYYDELRSIGILYDNPESAATAVNHIYNNVNAWWHKPERQRVIKRFCNRFAKTSQTAREDWIHELIRLSKAPTQRDKRAGY
jgi:putative transferase (TIGR04331 family)